MVGKRGRVVDEHELQATLAHEASRTEGSSHPPACLGVVYGPEPGRRYEVAERPLTIGRDPTSDICLDQDSISRTHAIITVEVNGVVVRDQGSSNGTYIGSDRIHEATLKHGDFIKVGRSILWFTTVKLPSTAYEQLHRILVTDELTGVYNERYLPDALGHELSRARRSDWPLALMIIEVDHLEQFDDEPDHRTKHFTVRSVATLVRDRTRKVDVVARTADAQFSVIVPERRLDQAVELAETIRKAIEQAHLEFEGRPIQLTVSMGVAELEPDTADTDALFQVALARAMRAKSLGCNRVVSTDREADEG